MSKSLPKIVAVVVGVFAFVACSADSKPAPGTSGKAFPSASSSSSSSASASASSGPAQLTITAAEPAANTFTFDTRGVESLPGGPVHITFVNTGATLHEVRIVKVRDGDFAAFRTALLALPAGADPSSLGDLVAQTGSITAGGQSTFDVELSAGTYALVSFLRAPDGQLLAQHGMVRELTVTPT